jgi:hypothetical protein
MAKKKNTIPNEFEDVLGSIYSNAEQGEGVTNMNTLLEGDTKITFEEEKEDEKEPPVNTEDGDKTDDTKDSLEDNSDIPEEVLKNTETKTTEVDEEDTKEGETEPS